MASIISPKRLSRVAIAIKPSTLLKFHKALVKRKYHLLFSNKTPKKSGPKGPDQAIVNAIIEMKKRNPSYGQRRIAMQISNAFGVEIDKDIVRRVLNKHFKNTPTDNGPSWLTFLGHVKDSLWSIDFFMAESIHLKSHWIMVVMDQFSRRIIGFSVHAGNLDGTTICCMFNKIISKKIMPKYLSSDNDPLFTFHRWQANLRILDIEEIKSVPHVPTSHPFIERVIGTCRRELLDKTLFWNANDLQNKLDEFQSYYNELRCHSGISGSTPAYQAEKSLAEIIDINAFSWKKHYLGIFNLPIAA